jgi:hypothetical protein
VLFLGVSHELPVVAEGAAVAVAEVLKDDLAGLAEAGRHLEKVNEVLSGQAAGKGLAGRREDGERTAAG